MRPLACSQSWSPPGVISFDEVTAHAARSASGIVVVAPAADTEGEASGLGDGGDGTEGTAVADAGGLSAVGDDTAGTAVSEAVVPGTRGTGNWSTTVGVSEVL